MYINICGTIPTHILLYVVHVVVLNEMTWNRLNMRHVAIAHLYQCINIIVSIIISQANQFVFILYYI